MLKMYSLGILVPKVIKHIYRDMTLHNHNINNLDVLCRSSVLRICKSERASAEMIQNSVKEALLLTGVLTHGFALNRWSIFWEGEMV